MFWTNAVIDVLLVIYVVNCLFMGLVIMMQRSKQEGLGAAFGGSITEGIWGAQTSNVLVKATVVCTIIFFSLSVVLARLYSTQAAHNAQPSNAQQLLSQPVPAPAVPPTTNNVTPTGAPQGSVPATTPVPVPAANTAPATAPVPATATPSKPAPTPTPAKSNR